MNPVAIADQPATRCYGGILHPVWCIGDGGVDVISSREEIRGQEGPDLSEHEGQVRGPRDVAAEPGDGGVKVGSERHFALAAIRIALAKNA